jgi:uncharacterized membrane protein YczE
MTTITPPAAAMFTPTPSYPAPTIDLERRRTQPPRATVPRSPIPLAVRVVLMVGGSAGIGVFVAVLIWNGLGPGPVDVLVVGVSARTGLSLTLTVWSVFGVMNLIAWIMGRRPGIGTVTAPMIAGFVIEVAVSGLDSVERPDMLIVRLLVQFIGIGAIGIGAASIMKSDLGAGPSELLTTAFAEPNGWSEPRVRTAIELSCLVLGVTLGGPMGVGTGILALIIGSSVSLGVRVVDRVIAPLEFQSGTSTIRWLVPARSPR